MPNDNETIPDRVEDVVLAWADLDSPVPTATALKVIWGDKAASVPFPDPATFQLINLLTQEFLSGNDARILRGLKPSLFADGGTIVSIDDLSEFVNEAPQPVQQHALIAGFSNPRAQAQMVSAIANEVVKRIKPTHAPAKKKKQAPAKKAQAAAKKKPAKKQKKARS